MSISVRLAAYLGLCILLVVGNNTRLTGLGVHVELHRASHLKMPSIWPSASFLLGVQDFAENIPSKLIMIPADFTPGL